MKAYWINRNFLTAVLAISIFTMIPVVSHASEGVSFSEKSETFSGEAVTLEAATDAFETPSEDGNVAYTFSAGDSVFVTGEEGEFKTIFYQGKTLYIKEGFSGGKQTLGDDTGSQSVISVESDEYDKALRQEFEEAEKENAAFIEAYVRLQSAKKRALIWKIVIGVLVVALLAISVIIGLKNKKASET